MHFSRKRNLVNTTALLLLLLPAIAAHAEEVLNLGPLLYIDRDEQSGTKSIDALGPFVSYKKTPDTVEYGFRPIFYNYRDYRKDRTAFDFLYPLMTHRSFEGDTKFQLIEYLFYYSSDLRPSGFRGYSYMLFPFVFGRKDENPEESYFALFPVYGKMRHKFGKDEVNFFLFPLFLQTKEGGATNNNFVWPFIGVYSGGGVSGGRLWPLYGWRGKEGDFEDEFAIPGRAEADDLGEDGGASAASDSVACLVPPVVGGHAEPLDRGAVVEELADLLL